MKRKVAEAHKLVLPSVLEPKPLPIEMEVIPSKERGVLETPSLQSRYSFSCESYYNLQRLNFGTLRILNEEIIEPGKGVPIHTHENMEIITLVLQGALKQRDTLGNQMIIPERQMHRLSAGRGISHEETNASTTEKVHFLQIWIFPKERNFEPTYEQKKLIDEEIENQLCLIASSASLEKSLSIRQDAQVFLGKFEQGKEIKYLLSSRKNGVYLFVIAGDIKLGFHRLKTGDAAQITRADEGIACIALTASEILLIEVSLQTL